MARRASAADDSPGSGVGSFRGYGLASARIVFGPNDDGTEYGFERTEPVKAVIRLASPVKSQGTTYSVRISDSFGRLLVTRAFAAPSSNEPLAEIPIEVPVPNAVVQRHTLHVTVSPSDGNVQSAERPFLFRAGAAWDDYICTVWQRHNEQRIPYLQEMFVTGSQWSGSVPVPPNAWVDHNWRFYIEGTGNWVYAPYHIFMADKDKTYYYEQAKKAFIADRTDMRILERDPCLSNHIVQDRIKAQFGGVGRLYKNYRPLYYTVADESGIANQAAPFDFCFSPDCKTAFREWLKKRYASLEALNKQWGKQLQELGRSPRRDHGRDLRPQGGTTSAPGPITRTSWTACWWTRTPWRARRSSGTTRKAGWASAACRGPRPSAAGTSGSSATSWM